MEGFEAFVGFVQFVVSVGRNEHCEKCDHLDDFEEVGYFDEMVAKSILGAELIGKKLLD